jgi:hypothetical protein
VCVCSADAAEERPQEEAPGADGVPGEVRVWGNLVAFVERLDDEMFKSLQVRSDRQRMHRDSGRCHSAKHSMVRPIS